MDLLAVYQGLKWDIETFRQNTQKIAESLADISAELGSRQNLSNDQYIDLYEQTSITDDLAKGIVDKLTDLSGLEEDENPSMTDRLVRGVMIRNTEKELEDQFKPAFEHFQKLHRQVMERQRVEIASLRSSMAQSITAQDDISDCVVHITPEVVNNVFRPASEVMVDDEITPHYSSNEESVQLLKAGSDNQLLLELMRERQRDMLQMESKAIELYDIQSKLAVLTKRHGDQIDIIEETVGETEVVTTKATEQLQQAETHKHAATRKKWICVLILIIAAILLILILGTSIYYKIV